MDKVIEQISIYGASKTKHAPIWLEFRKSGYNIISTWIDEYQQGESESLRDLAIRCIEEPMKADVTILYVEPEDHIKFALAEVGAALGAGKPVIIVGNCKCLSETMLQHPNIRKVNTFLLAMSLLREIAAQKMNAPTTPATSWEEVEKKAREEWMLKHAGEAVVKYDCNFNNYFVEYLSQHWPSSQPVSPTPMSETWGEVERKNMSDIIYIYTGVPRQNELHQKLGDMGIIFSDRLRVISAIDEIDPAFFSDTCTKIPAPSLHQVDRWVRVEDLVPECAQEVLALCEGKPYVLSYNGEDKFYMDFHMKQYYEDWTHWVTHWQPLPAAPETDKTT